ncbi:MAG: Crp/Fnr family transcriptional regulator, partial [Bdellovibrionota bacterium]
ERRKFLIAAVEKGFPGSLIYTSLDGSDALFKMKNDLPHVAILDRELTRTSVDDIVKWILSKSGTEKVAVVVAGNPPDEEAFVDEIIQGHVQFLLPDSTQEKAIRVFSKALNFISQNSEVEYRLKFLNQGDVLFTQGSNAEHAYILKRGTMEAVREGANEKVVLGEVIAGEFVGEMAHINGEPRSATVLAKTDCELIEIPFDSFELLLFSKPAWSKALVATLSKRLQKTLELTN